MKVYNIRDGLFEPIINKFYEDPTLIAYGEDNRDWGGALRRLPRHNRGSIPYHRFFNSPISESAIVGSAVGYAMCGGRVIVELMYCRLHRLRGRRDIQPDGQVAGDVRRYPQDADDPPCLGRLQVRRTAFSGLDSSHRSYPGPEGRLPGHSVRRQGSHDRAL